MKRLIATCHEAVAAVSRAEAEMQDVLPSGTRVVINGRWSATVKSICLPMDGHLVVIPDDAIKTSGYRQEIGGGIVVHVEWLEIISRQRVPQDDWPEVKA